MRTVKQFAMMLALLPISLAALAGDMLKPWASVISGPNRSPGYHWTYESFEYESACQKENAYRLSKLQKSPASPGTRAHMEDEAENAIQVPQPPEPDAEHTSVSRSPVATTMGCVYQGSKYQTLLKLRNMGNAAVLCIAKEKKLRDYRVVLAGAPRETDDYRCD